MKHEDIVVKQYQVGQAEVSIMLISACPVNAVTRMVDTSFYVAISALANGVVYKFDASPIVDTASYTDITLIDTTTNFTTDKFTSMAQVGSTTKVLLGGRSQVYDYTSNSITKTASDPKLFNCMDCIDSSTCIALDASTTQFARFTTVDFLGSLLTY